MADILPQRLDPRPSVAPEPARIGAMLEAVVSGEGEVTVGALLDRVGTRAFGLLLILLNLPNVIFAPPVLAGIAAFPIAALGGQLMVGRTRPWLPEPLLLRPVSAAALRRVLAVSKTWLDRLDAAGRPRLPWAAGPGALRLLGAFAVLAAVIVLLPVPGTNVLPALSVIVIAVGAMRRDGLLVLLGAAAGVAGLLVAALAAGLAVEVVRWLWGMASASMR